MEHLENFAWKLPFYHCPLWNDFFYELIIVPTCDALGVWESSDSLKSINEQVNAHRMPSNYQLQRKYFINVNWNG